MLGYLLGPLKGQTPKRGYGSSAGALMVFLLAYLGIDKAKEILDSITSTDQIFKLKDPLADVGDEAFRNFPGLATYKPLLSLIEANITGKPSFPVTLLRTNFENGQVQFVTANPDGTFVTEGDTSTKITDIAGLQGALCSSCINGGAVDSFLDFTNGKDKPGVPYIDGGYSELIPIPKAIRDGATSMTVLMTGMFSDPALSDKGGDIVAGIIDGYSIFVHNEMVTEIQDGAKALGDAMTVFEARPVGSSDNFNVSDNKANVALGLIAQPVKGSAFLP